MNRVALHSSLAYEASVFKRPLRGAIVEVTSCLDAKVAHLKRRLRDRRESFGHVALALMHPRQDIAAIHSEAVGPGLEHADGS